MSEDTAPIGNFPLGVVRIDGADHEVKFLGKDDGWVTVESTIQFGGPQAPRRIGQARTLDEAKALVERVKAERDWGPITWTIP